MLLEFLREQDQLRFVLHVKHVVLGLESLVKLIQAGHFSDQVLTRSEVRLFGLILKQSAFVEIELTIACVAAILDEIEQRV